LYKVEVKHTECTFKTWHGLHDKSLVCTKQNSVLWFVY